MSLISEKIIFKEVSWLQKLSDEFTKPYWKNLEAFLAEEIQSRAEIYPPLELVFNAFCQTPFEKVKVVIVGQDPYHGFGQAHGLAFSVPKGIPIPRSLANIFKELNEDLGIPPANHGCLLSWAKQGVLLLNATLTVRAKEPKSHFGQGWEIFTDRVIQLLSLREDPIAFLLWGKSAEEKCEKILSTSSHHLILTAPHPSPFSARTGFFGCRHFSKTNDFLKKIGKTPIDWSLDFF